MSKVSFNPATEHWADDYENLFKEHPPHGSQLLVKPAPSSIRYSEQSEA